VDTAKELPTVLSFCSGYGGIERGLDLAGFKHRVIAFSEIEAYAIANLANKMEAGELLPAPIWSNLKTLPVEPFRDKVSLLTSGYPCQPFSAAGERKGEDDPRHLWPFIRKHIESIRPVQCFFENVEGHISLGLREVISDLESLGYVCAWGIFSAREVGAPHQRKRVYILADSNGVRCDRRELSDRVSQRSVAIEAQQRPEQPVVRSKVKGCGGDSGEDVAYPRCGASSEGIKQAQLWSTGAGESPESTREKCGQAKNVQGQKWPSGPNQEQYEWEQPRTVWKTKPELGGTFDGHSNRVDRIRLLGNGVVPQTAAKAWVTLNSRLNTTEGR
jgi:DNA (cytosine-5)-methyltransferase 1